MADGFELNKEYFRDSSLSFYFSIMKDVHRPGQPKKNLLTLFIE